MNPDYSLYLIFDPCFLTDFETKNFVQEVISGGITMLQLRMKAADRNVVIAKGRLVKEITDSFNIPLIINDDIFAALELGASGVHIGQNDMPLQKARRLLGKKAVIGLSVSSIDEALSSTLPEVDYLGVGPIFATETKMDANIPMGLSVAAHIRKLTSKPLVAIGGLNATNAGQLMGLGMNGIALCSAICRSLHPRAATMMIKKLIVKEKYEFTIRS